MSKYDEEEKKVVMTADHTETYAAGSENSKYMKGGGMSEGLMSGSSPVGHKSGWEYAGKYDPSQAHWDFGDGTGAGDIGFSFLPNDQ